MLEYLLDISVNLLQRDVVGYFLTRLDQLEQESIQNDKLLKGQELLKQ